MKIKSPVSFTRHCKVAIIIMDKKTIRLILTLLKTMDLIEFKFDIPECINRLGDYIKIK